MHHVSAPAWRQTLDRFHATLVDDLTAQVSSEIESSVSLAIAEERARTAGEAIRVSDEARRRLSESLNQTLRRIRKTSAEHETLQLLLEDSAACAERAVVLLVENNQARIAASRSVSLRDEEEDQAPIELLEAAAMAACVETRDPMVALATPGEISSTLASALAGSGSDKIYLFPITVRQGCVALLLANGAVAAAPMELLCEVAGMKLESLEVPIAVKPQAAPVSTPLVKIAGTANDEAAPGQRKNEPAAWTKLSADEQALHLKAQRAARVRVAQMRISESGRLRTGVRTGDIYGALRSSIDAAREEFRQSYIMQSPTMIDYLHMEMTRSLAHDDSRLMGQDYPGPMV